MIKIWEEAYARHKAGLRASSEPPSENARPCPQKPRTFPDSSDPQAIPVAVESFEEMYQQSRKARAGTLSAVDPKQQWSPHKPVQTPAERPPHPVDTESQPVLIQNTSERLPGISFVLVAPGNFVMGSSDHEPGRGDDEHPHEVTLTRGYSIQTTPITQGQWQAVMGSLPANFLWLGSEDCPVVGATWNACQEFIKRMNKKGEHLYRLPTEAEWEYACRAGTSTPFASGEISELFCRDDPCLNAVGWYCGNSNRRTHPVAQNKPNDWGLYDMHGNVCEWCSDWYGAYAAAPQTDPVGAASGPGRVIRGGSWFSNAQNCRSASRFYWTPNSRSDFIGFRLVREVA